MDDFFYSIEILLITFHIKVLASGSIPALGSSSKIIEGYPINEIANVNFRLLPPDKFPDSIFLYRFKFNFISKSLIIF